ncbi:MAG: TolC family outer membrane protein [Granulosicoccus sp.]
MSALLETGRFLSLRFAAARQRCRLLPNLPTGLLFCFALTTGAQAADLREVYEQAKQYDAEFQAAQFDLQAARQRVPLAKSAFRPQISINAEAGINAASSDGQGSYEDTALSLSVTQTLFNRSNSKLIEQAELGVLQAEAQYAAVGQTLILRAATVYFDVLRAQANVEFSQSELQAISRQREQAERRFDVGLVPITDVRTAQAQYDLAVAQEIAASNQLSTAQEALRRISGLEVDLLTPLASDLPLAAPDPADIDTWVELAMDQNLELVIARLNSQSSSAQVGIERGNRYPTLDLVGVAASNTTEQLGRDDVDASEIKLQLRIPVLTGGRVNAQVAQAKSQALSDNQQLIVQQRTTTQQTRDSYRGVLASISLVRALRQALVSTQKSAESAEAGFRAGTRTSVEVLQALRDTYSARSDYAGSRYDYIINSLNLRAASGTLTEEDLFAINRFLAFPE